MTDTLSREIETINNFNNKYVSSPISNLNTVELQLLKIFEDEVNSENSVILDYKPAAIRRLARFLTGEITRSASVGVAGETASGKSTITLDIIDTIELFANVFNLGRVITRVNTDDYYYDRSEMVKAAGSFAEFAKHYDLDVPEALELSLMKDHIMALADGREVYLPEYDMSGTAIRRDDVKLATPAKIIISEGLFTLTPRIIDAFDFKIYVHVSHEVQKERFYIRAEERGLGASSDEVYENALSKAKVHIRPTINSADIVLSGEADRTAYKAFVNKILDLVKSVHNIESNNISPVIFA